MVTEKVASLTMECIYYMHSTRQTKADDFKRCLWVKPPILGLIVELEDNLDTALKDWVLALYRVKEASSFPSDPPQKNAGNV